MLLAYLPMLCWAGWAPPTSEFMCLKLSFTLFTYLITKFKRLHSIRGAPEVTILTTVTNIYVSANKLLRGVSLREAVVLILIFRISTPLVHSELEHHSTSQRHHRPSDDFPLIKSQEDFMFKSATLHIHSHFLLFDKGPSVP